MLDCSVLSLEKTRSKLSGRVRNQLRIHWKWLRHVEDYNDVADFVIHEINQVLDDNR